MSKDQEEIVLREISRLRMIDFLLNTLDEAREFRDDPNLNLEEEQKLLKFRDESEMILQSPHPGMRRSH